MLTDRQTFGKLHLAWCLATCLAALLCAAWYWSESRGAGRWPGGGSRSGICFGVAAGLIFLFEFALWPRKTSLFRTSRWLGKTQTWMKAHIWLGLLAAPLVLLHCGFHFGGVYTWIFAWLSLLVIGSGIFGLLLQNLLPRLLVALVPQETVATQIDEVARQYTRDAQQLLELVVEDAAPAIERESGPPRAVVHHAGVQRRVGAMREKTLQPEVDLPRPIRSPQLLAAVKNEIQPYLLRGRSVSGLLGTRQKNDRFFEELKLRAPVEARWAIESLAALCERRRQLTLQSWIHFCLHAWMMVHLPLSVALLVLLAGHIYLALRIG